MKQILAVFSVIFSLFFLNACDDEKSNAISESKVIRFQVEIPNHEPEAGTETTRVDVNTLKFEHEDEIGLFVVKRDKEQSTNFVDNAKMTYDSHTNTWVVYPPVSYFPSDKSPDVMFDFYAYYPYIRGVDPTAMKIWGVLDNQENSINLGRSDFMTACKTNYIISNEFVKLSFTHHFSLVTLEYHIGSGQSLPFIGIRSAQYIVDTFRLDSVAKGVSSLTCERRLDGDILTGMSPLKIAEGSGITTYAYQAIVVPQILDDGPLFYTLKKDDNQFFSINTQDAFMGFERGKAYRFSAN
ncbi:hypothetical protein EZS27_014967 [termite gut metagenome]|uniref:Fimbrillin family protein n=1 Tax=termite gut metagenome TaxID=433724 RepID=A0A5J4RT26_9ZZZZ